MVKSPRPKYRGGVYIRRFRGRASLDNVMIYFETTGHTIGHQPYGWDMEREWHRIPPSEARGKTALSRHRAKRGASPPCVTGVGSQKKSPPPGWVRGVPHPPEGARTLAFVLRLLFDSLRAYSKGHSFGR